VLHGHYHEKVLDAAFSPDGNRVVTAGSHDGTARVWDARTGAKLLTLEHPKGQVCSACFSPDGNRILTVSTAEDGKVRLFDTRSGELLMVMPWEDYGSTFYWPLPMRSAAFSPDGRRVVVAEPSGKVRVWSVEKEEVVLTLPGHGAFALTAAYSPDGERIITAGGDESARVWDARTGELLAELGTHESAVSTVLFSPDGDWILTLSAWEGRERFWPSDPLPLARRRKPRDLTLEERRKFGIGP
jgi:WD40 repeat protein